MRRCVAHCGRLLPPTNGPSPKWKATGACGSLESRGVDGFGQHFTREPTLQPVLSSTSLLSCSLHTDGGPSMSSITFPNAGQSLTGPTSSSNDGDMGFFTGPFDGASNSSFQMNPLSSHPPRTPRTSIVSSAYEYGGDIYTPKEELIEQQAESVVSEDEDDAHASRVRKENVWHDLLKTAYGRDKTFVR